MRRPVFVCQECGACCYGEGGIVVSPAEVEAISAFLEISAERFTAEYTLLRNGKREIRTGAGGACLFMKEKHCSIQPVKPEVCRRWPYLPGALKDEEGFLSLKGNCPGIDPQADWADFLAEYQAIQEGRGPDSTRPPKK